LSHFTHGCGARLREEQDCALCLAIPFLVLNCLPQSSQHTDDVDLEAVVLVLVVVVAVEVLVVVVVEAVVVAAAAVVVEAVEIEAVGVAGGE
jgi:hypothetical protein